jgi:L-cysteine desulfidase
MGTYSEIEDLWDDLNNRDFDKILEQWNVKLSKSNIPLWNQLIKKIEELKESEPDKYKKSQGKVYNSDTNDHDITISAYLTNLVSVHIDDHSTNRQQGNQNREQNSQRKSDDGIGSLDD